MEVKVDLTTEAIERFTSDTLSLSAKDKISFKGAEFGSIPCKPIYSGFVNLAVRILTMNDGITRHVTTDAATKETVEWVTIERTVKTEPIFEPFKRTGVYVSKIMCGICFDTDVMYTGTKLCKELGRLGDIPRAEFYAYLYSVVKYISDIQKNPIVANVGYLGKYDVNMTPEEFAERLPSFDKAGKVTYVKDVSSSDVSTILYDKTGVSKVDSTYTSSKTMQFAVTRYKEKSMFGLFTMNLAARTYTFLIAKNNIATDYDLCLLELSSDSICTALAAVSKESVKFTHVDSLPLDKDYVIESCDDQESLISSCPAWLGHWCRAMFKCGAEYADADTLKHFTAMGVKLDSAIEVADPEAVRKSYESDEYAQELYKQTHPYYDTFDLGNVAANVKGFSTGAIYSMAFIGESGTGKSTAARVLPTRCGFPYVSVNFSVNIEESDLFGAMVPNPKKTCAEDPEFIWQDGIVTKAVRNGYCVVLEEINFARPGVLGKLNSLLDENRQIDLSNGEIVRAHPNFRMIATCNIAYEGTNRFNKALINRFDDVTVFEDPSREAAIKIIKERTGYSNASKLAKVYDVYEALKKFSKEQGVDAVVSMRQLLNLFTKGKYYKDARDAVKRIMLNGAFIEDSEYLKVFEETVLPAFDLKFKI